MKKHHVFYAVLFALMLTVFGMVIQDLTIVRKFTNMIDRKVNELTVDFF